MTLRPFGEILRDLRKQNGFTQVQVAEKLTELFPDRQMSQVSYSNLENRTKAPRGEILEKLAYFFGVGVGYFYQYPNQERIERAKKYIEYLRENRPAPPAED